MSKETGFTLIELVVVILILSILAATALPKFMNVQDQAHEAAVAGAGGGFGSGVALAHAQWIANGTSGATSNVNNFGGNDLDVNANGWPTGTDDSNSIDDATDCIEIWNGIMQNPPTVSTGATTDYLAARAAQTCTYTYNGASNMTIFYGGSQGTVTVDHDSSS